MEECSWVAENNSVCREKATGKTDRKWRYVRTTRESRVGTNEWYECCKVKASSSANDENIWRQEGESELVSGKD